MLDYHSEDAEEHFEVVQPFWIGAWVVGHAKE
jgi:hypothetical protein